MPDRNTTRRRFIAGAGAAGAALAAAPGPALAREGRRHGAVRLLHFTDPHVTPDIPRSEPLTRRALEIGLSYRPDLIVQGGDAIYDALYADQATTERQWAAHQRIWKGVRTPVAHVLGNHDCWQGPDSEADPTGKAVALAQLGLRRSYYARTLGRWKLIVLDSIELTGGGAYVGRLGDEQTAWLDAELSRTPDRMHVVLATHIPIQTALPFTDSSLRAADGAFTVPPGWGVHSDLPELNELFIDHPNVRLALSGHNHVRDDITYNTVRFACGGSIAGNWWDEADPGYRDTPAGFAVVDLQRDGTADVHYWSYREVDDREVSADGPARGSVRSAATVARGVNRVPNPPPVLR
jgi:3',5'-cyclic AMP phosphodiesterase CpdA